MDEYPKRIYVGALAITVENAEEEARYLSPSEPVEDVPDLVSDDAPAMPHPYAKRPVPKGAKKK